MNDKAVVGVFTIVLLALIAGAMWWKSYEWHQCRHVGYSWLHCTVQAL